MLVKKLFSAAAIASCLFAASCLKNDTTPTTEVTYTEPEDEINTIDSFTNAMGYFDMQYDPDVTGLKYETIELGDTTNGKISSATPVGEFKYKVLNMKGQELDSTYSYTDSTISVNLSSQSTSTIPALMYTNIWSYYFLNTSTARKIGKGGHLRFVTPSLYTAYNYNGNTTLLYDSPLFVDVELKDVRSN